MRRTQLYIKVNNNWKEIDLFDDIVVPITMKVTDIRQFGSKTSSYSLDFDIPHTNNNAQVFGLNSEIDVYESTFEVGKDYPAYMTNDTFTVFDGQFRLKKVIKKNRGTYIYYVGYLYGGAKNFVDALGNETLIGNDDASRDLNFSEYATPAADMQLADFADYLQTKYTDATGWALTLLDKTNKAAQPFTSGYQQWYADETTPYLYAIEIFNKIFAKTSYRYDSEFLKGADFSTYLHDSRWANGIGKYDVNSIIYPFMKNNSNFNGNEVTVDVTQLDTTSTCVISRGEVIYNNNTIVRWDLISRTMEFDSNQYLFSQNHAAATFPSYEFTATDYGVYDIKYKFPVEARLLMRKTDDSVITPYPDPVTGRTSILTSHPQYPDIDRSYVVYIGIEKNGSLITSTRQTINQNLQPEYSTNSQYGGNLYFEQSDYTGNTECYLNLGVINVDVNLQGVYLNIGDTLKFYMWISVPVRYYGSDIVGYQPMFYYINYDTQATVSCFPKWIEMKLKPSLNPNEPNIIHIYSPPSFKEGVEFDPTAILNPKTTKLDFFNYFVKMFNLYVEDVSGKVNYSTGGIYPPNTLRIEPYQIYYAPELAAGQTNLKDWTSKIDWESVEYRRCDDYLYNIQRFTKSQDNDFYNDNYNNTFKESYGNREVKGIYCTNTNDINNIELKISANMCGVVNNQTDTLQCPKVFTLDKSGNIDIKKEYSDGLFFIWDNDMQSNTTIGANYFVRLQSRVNPISSRTLTQYYTADTLNKGYGADDANLNWGGTETYYQNMKGTIPTYNDLYNAFYAKEYDEKTAPDAMIMRANAYLTAQDIYNLQLSDMIICNGNHWHILEVNQWKDEKTPCQIELIKTKPNAAPTVVRPKPPVLLDPPVLPIATDNATLLQKLSQLTEELRDTNDRLNNANEQIGELEEQLSAIPADIHKIPMRIVFNDQAVGERKVVSAEVSEQMYNALRSGSWNASTVSKRGDNATIVLDRTNNGVVPEYIRGTATVNLDTMCKPMYERKANSKASKPSKSNTTVSKWYAIPGSKKVKPNSAKMKKGMYAASWRHTYA